MYSISKETYSYKDKRDKTIDYRTMRFQKKDTGLSELLYFIQFGHAIAHNFGLEEFGLREKRDDNFQSASFISLDVDGCSVNMEDCMKGLDKIPTFAYYTASNGHKGDGFRFRFIYLFHDPIRKEQYKPLAKALDLYLRNNIQGYDNKDKCSENMSQFYFGADEKEAKVIVNKENIYDQKDFENEIQMAVEELNQTKPKIKNTSGAIHKQRISIDKDFLNDLENLSYEEFAHKYSHVRTLYHSIPIDYNEQFGVYQYDKDKYIEIQRKYTIDEDRYGNKRPHLQRWQDGENRRKRLFATAVCFRHIDPSISTENLCINLLRERDYFYDNSDEVLDNNTILGICVNCMRIPIEELENRYNGRRKGFSVDKNFCLMNGIKAQAQIQKFRAFQNHNRILEYYDDNKSYKENLRILSDNGIKTSYSTLKRIHNKYFLESVNMDNIIIEREEEGELIHNEPIQKRRKGTISYEEIGSIYDVSKSLKDNLLILKGMGMKIGKDKLYRFCKDNNIPTNPNK